MFRTKLSPDDNNYIYSNDFETIIFSNERNPNPYQEFFEIISDNTYAKENIEEVCIYLGGKAYYENDVLEDMNNPEYYFVQKDIFNCPIFFTHDFSSINAFNESMFSVVNNDYESPLDGDTDEFLEAFKKLKDGEIKLTDNITLRHDGTRFVSNRIFVDFKGHEISFDVFSDYDDNPFKLLVSIKVTTKRGVSSYIRKTLQEAFCPVAKELMEFGATFQEIQSLYEHIESTARHG